MTPDELAQQWLHGFRDLPGDQFSPWLNSHVHNQGVVHALIHQLSKLLGCEESMDAIAKCRAEKLKEGVSSYADFLYQDGNIQWTLIDSDLPWNDPVLNLFPGKVLRHIQMDPIFFDLLSQCDHFADMKQKFVCEITDRVHQGYVSIKSHVGETFTTNVHYVSDEEAEKNYLQARSGDYGAQREVYYAIFHQAMLTAQSLQIPIHIHTGITGGYWDGKMYDTDPYALGPFLRNVPHMMDTDLVLLHCNYPYVGGAAMMAQTFPHVWVDLAWVLPWTALQLDRSLEDLLAIAPTSKIMLGSGQHNIPEIAWLASKVARISLDHVLSEKVRQDLLSDTQAETIAKQILSENACRLYHLI